MTLLTIIVCEKSMFELALLDALIYQRVAIMVGVGYAGGQLAHSDREHGPVDKRHGTS